MEHPAVILLTFIENACVAPAAIEPALDGVKLAVQEHPGEVGITVTGGADAVIDVVKVVLIP